jgi:hypothetical protein
VLGVITLLGNVTVTGLDEVVGIFGHSTNGNTVLSMGSNELEQEETFNCLYMHKVATNDSFL